ncbi:hypothetical protein KIL84_002131 [Mauremys mutica]|uniref:SAP domain-containing protein n=1 Tax=Mauremys mutica TaxID=74926 RepID=A0A9D4AYG3_9SAUR|nr:hypothetical protein KIL84_002131 [Mauremys mutica]
MTRRRHVFGRRPQPDKGGYVDTFLCAPDILPRHCCVREAEPAPGPALVRPFRGAAVTLNGGALVREAALHPGDLLGLGQHFLFMYKDPRTPQPRPAWLPRPWVSPGLAGAFSCQACGRSLQERQDAFQAYVESREPELRYRPQEEEALLREIVRLQGATAFNLAPAFLLGLCLEHSTRVLEPSHFPRLVARMAQLIKEAVWEKIKEVGDRQPENDLETCDEAMAVLDEVIMSTFQQSVYYLTKGPPRPKKAKDPKPKVRKLKYHQYVPPAARPPRAPAPLDAAYARLLQQQQLFLQLQILQQQQPPAPPGPPTALCVPALHPLSASISPDPVISFAAPPITLAAPPTPPTPPVPPKPELLPANLDDLTVSELRQQLRQRGLPVSGTKPALLERLKPFQVRGAPGPPPPALPPADRALREKQRLIDSLTWELQREQQEADDLREELQLHKCRRGRPEGEPLPPSPPASHGPQAPAGETPEGTAPRREGFLVFCPPSCEPIGEDLELPLQITASPAPAPRSLEEELQEAIQKAQLVPSQSIEDILEEPLACAGDLLPTDAPLLLPTEPRRPPSPLSQQGAPCKKPRRTPPAAAILDFPSHYDFLTPPSSSSSSPSDSLRGVFSPEPPEGPPSPSPRPAFDPVDWLEALTSGPASGLGPGTPGGSSIFSTDFFDSPELSVNHMIDLMVEQW